VVRGGSPAHAPHPPVNPGMQARRPGALGFLAHVSAEDAVAAAATAATGAFHLTGAPGCGGGMGGGMRWVGATKSAEAEGQPGRLARHHRGGL